MSCVACSKRYGLFCKEYGCPNCGFSFCAKCLRMSVEVPKFNNATKKVCLTCYEKLTRAKEESLAAVDVKPREDPLNTPIPDDVILPNALNAVDETIKNRLKLLKDEAGASSSTTDKDIAIRISNLKGVEREMADKSLLLNVDTRSDQEKSNQLLKQLTEETDIDRAHEDDAIKMLEKRLNLLRDHKPNVESTNDKEEENSSDSDNDEDKVKKLVNRYMEESKLPNSELSPEEIEFCNSIPRAPTPTNEPELPWCHICNEDADIEYKGDLFCKDCYKEFKDDD